MFSRAQIAILIAAMMLCTWGCATPLPEDQLVQAFSTGLDEQQLQALTQHSTENFREKALRHPSATQDIRLLRIPTKEVKVLEVKEISADEKHVVVAAGSSERKIMYQLKRMPGSEQWLVDDIYLKQGKRNGTNVVRSVTEQMDLLLTVREFMNAWESGDRDEVLMTVTPELRSALDVLPPSFLAQVARKLSSGRPSGANFRPEAELIGNRAVVRVPGRTGDLLLTMKLNSEAWQVSDLAIESKDDQEHINSLKKVAMVTNTAVDFLKEYRNANKSALENVTTRSFYRNTLEPGELKTVQLPIVDGSALDYDMKVFDRRADFILENEDEIVRIGLIQANAEEDDEPADYRVDEATIYELASKQEKRLGALLTATSIMRVFQDAMLAQDLDILKQVSTTEFNNLAWDRVSPTVFRVIQLAEMEHAEPRVTGTSFNGHVTEITVLQGTRELTYVLREQANQVRVDDVIVVDDQQLSLREKLAVTIPIYEFAYAVFEDDTDKLQALSSKDFNRRVWSQTRAVPRVHVDLVRSLTAPINQFRLSTTEAVAQLGGPEMGAKVHLVKEAGRLRVNDAVILGRNIPGEEVSMKQTMRLQLAYGTTSPSQILQASKTMAEERQSKQQSARSANYEVMTEVDESEMRYQRSAEVNEYDPPIDATYREPRPLAPQDDGLFTPIPIAPR